MRIGKSRVDGADVFFGGLGVMWVALILACIGAWATHVVWIIAKLASDKGATVGQMVLGGLGAFMPPVGVVHGFMIWLGVGF